MALSPLANLVPSEELRLAARRVDTDLVQDIMLGMISPSELVWQVSDVPRTAVARWASALGSDKLNTLLLDKGRYSNLYKVKLTREKENVAKKISYELTGAIWAVAGHNGSEHYFDVLLLVCGVPRDTVLRWIDEDYDLRNAVILLASGVTGDVLENAVASNVDVDILTSTARRF